MNRLFKITCLALLAIMIVAAGCASSRNSHCGCPNKSGMVGYK